MTTKASINSAFNALPDLLRSTNPFKNPLDSPPIDKRIKAVDIAIGTGLTLYLLSFGFYALKSYSMWDFSAYYWAAKASLAGLDPYNTNEVSTLAGKELFPYLYPPLVTRLFYPLAILPPVAARIIYVALQYLAVAATSLLWRDVIRYASPKANSLSGILSIRLVILCFAFNASVIKVLRTGQITIFENLFLWLAISSILRCKYRNFGVAVIAAALPKVTPIALAFLPFLDRRKGSSFYCVISIVAAYVALILFQILFLGSEWASFRSALSFLDPEFSSSLPSEAWSNTPSILQVLLSIPPLSHSLSFALGSAEFAVLIYIAIVALCIAFLMCNSHHFLLREGQCLSNSMHTLLLVTIFVCLSPRLRDYSYVVMIFPLAFLFLYTRLGAVIFGCLSMVIPFLGWLPGFGNFGINLREFSSFYLALFTCISFLIMLPTPPPSPKPSSAIT